MLVIDGRFNGALTSGNGGYSAGVFSRFVEGLAEVNLRSPVPLDTALEVERSGVEARILHGDTLVAEVRPAEDIDLDVPRVDPAEARAAAKRYTGTGMEVFARCYVCGMERDDSFGVFAGPVDGREAVASPWTPPAWAADGAGHVRPEHVWGVLDCPTYFAAHLGQEATSSFLVRMSARVDEPVVAGEEHVVVAWPLGGEGRKREAASAVLAPGGDVLAVARVLLVRAR
jgi:hypothetical protein